MGLQNGMSVFQVNAVDGNILWGYNFGSETNSASVQLSYVNASPIDDMIAFT